ncbi:hypothetical protein MKW92_001795 [Papaver armeniacum]|nr:hypothetical protein MKW92_001795 [Papaver armeniacum]
MTCILFFIVEGHSIYIKNLPTTAMHRTVEKEFKSFGPIKPDSALALSNLNS